ncbi:MAG: hypothetical protein SGILL_002417 [Bacillariaceae sp.]
MSTANTNAKKKSSDDGAQKRAPRPTALPPPRVVGSAPAIAPTPTDVPDEVPVVPLPLQGSGSLFAWFAANEGMLQYFQSCMETVADQDGLIFDFPDDNSCEWRSDNMEQVNIRDPLFWELPAGVDIDVDWSLTLELEEALVVEQEQDG